MTAVSGRTGCRRPRRWARARSGIRPPVRPARSVRPTSRRPPPAAVGFGFQLRHHLDGVAAFQAGVPVDGLQGVREDDLGHVAPDAREVDDQRGGVRSLVGSRPVRGHQFVEPPPVERQGGLPLEVVPVLVQFFARIAPVDVALCIGDVSVHRHVEAIDESAHADQTAPKGRTHRDATPATTSRRRQPRG